VTEPPNTEPTARERLRAYAAKRDPWDDQTEPPNTEALLVTVRFRVGEIVSRTPQDDVIDEMEREVRVALDTIASELRASVPQWTFDAKVDELRAAEAELERTRETATETINARESVIDRLRRERAQALRKLERVRGQRDSWKRAGEVVERELVRREQHFNAFRDADERTIMEQEAELERANERKSDLWTRLLDMEGKYLDESARLVRAVEALREEMRRQGCLCEYSRCPLHGEGTGPLARIVAEIEESG
jgi:hypothetical protein